MFAHLGVGGLILVAIFMVLRIMGDSEGRGIGGWIFRVIITIIVLLCIGIMILAKLLSH